MDSTRELQPVNNALSIIDNVDIQQVAGTMQKIARFQAVIQKTLKQNHDFGVIPGSRKPTLLKPGAEKILMLMGLTSEYELLEKVQDYENGFFAFTVRCRLLKGDQLITEGLGHCNSREKKYQSDKVDPYTIANTCLKMAKKRAQIDATLTVASLSEVFTQDLEDMDLNGDAVGTQRTTFDDERTISKAQAKRLFALSNGDAELCKRIILKYGYTKSEDIKRIDYDKIAKEIEEEAKKVFEGTPFEDK
ncbi:hypothetical protein [Caloranaerobacter ferrireducens]|uniref:hypothetical protein n=1 Tax=Caloranaerobacter ferrireducens TaxID=1323370 RepID=UPI00084DD359|nr:hypothetical protein [Caloranaerobacter ferrireducens]